MAESSDPPPVRPARPRRNTRPRDALGRPLPYGAADFTPPLSAQPLTPAAVLEQAQRLLDEGLPFHAHELLEDAWKAAPAPERDLWRGLAQLAVGLTHLARGNRIGALSLLHRAATLLTQYRVDALYRIDVAGILSWVELTEQQLESGTELDRLSPVPRLRTN